MIRFCPHCHTERPLMEIFCAGQINNQPCGWDLTLESIHEKGWKPPRVEAVIPADLIQSDSSSVTNNVVVTHTDLSQCTNGHPMEVGELICFQCGADAAEDDQFPASNDDRQSYQTIGDWRLEQRVNSIDSTRERYAVTNLHSAQTGILTLYRKGEEPDPAIYQVLKLISVDHVPVFYDAGRWENRAWHVTEKLVGGSLSQFIAQGDFWRSDEIPKLLDEIGKAITAFTEHGLRHRDLRPSNLLIRSRDPLDVVLIEYGSASLSEFDLDIVSPLDISRYTAPETLAGGVCAASDW
ncbi:hypothetical protein M2263_000776 [Providencia alcalifaciens]|nr:hypothetical protein [Providencia alcalifaciens]